MSIKSHYRTCNLCEAMCGLKIEVEDQKILSIRGDKQDPLSQGHICPKALALQDLFEDQDRLTQPVMKTADGWKTISWDKAFSEVKQGLKKIQTTYGKDALGVYLGNPSVHNLEAMLYGSGFYNQLKTKNRYTATSVDQLPHHLAAMLMFGHPLLLPIPDIDRTAYMVILGANPMVSNGSLMSSPNIRQRLKAIQKREGKIVTIDPRFTETSKIADQHLFIAPGSDALLLLAMVNYLFNKNLINSGHLTAYISELEALKHLVSPYHSKNVAPMTGIEATDIENLVEDFCNAKRAVLYARIGVSTHEFGSLVNWLVNVFNLLTGNMDSAGGMMFTQPAIDLVGFKKPKGKKFARYFSRVKKFPETIGEFPVATLADEILTPGPGQIKGMITAAGNPLLSTPNNTRLAEAFSGLEFMLSIDFYINETTRHANIILPPPTPLERPHYDLVFNHLAVRNITKYSEALFSRPKGSLSEAEIYLKLMKIMSPSGVKAKLKNSITRLVMKWLGTSGMINKGLKSGPYGKSSKLAIKNLNLKKLKQHPHGLDLGELECCFPQKILTTDGKIHLAPEEFATDLKRLDQKYHRSISKKSVEEAQADPAYEIDAKTYPFLLIGRRDSRTCNSWLHNAYRLVKGKAACIAQMNDKDVDDLGLRTGQQIVVESRVGKLEIIVEATSDIMSGVISIPHGWGHGVEQTQMAIANAHAGVSVNQLTDDQFVDQLTGNAVLNGVAVKVSGL
ncbi:MAG: molybdopterin-dependent oxidoreductase [Enterobacterales bacterium]|nr:molybdopterin-dependent oxidoreductase [Enterobacterales bacterium]